MTVNVWNPSMFQCYAALDSISYPDLTYDNVLAYFLNWLDEYRTEQLAESNGQMVKNFQFLPHQVVALQLQTRPKIHLN